MADLCLELKIDDPIAWFRAVPASVVDFWMAHQQVKIEEAKGSKMKDPDTIRSTLDRQAG